MSDLKTSVRKNGVECVHKVVENGRQKFLCFSRLADANDAWVLMVTDGADAWKMEYDEEGLEAQRDLVNVSTTDAFLTRVRSGFNSGDLSVALVGTKLTLTVGKGAAAMDFDLFEAKAAEKKTELQAVLFRLAEQTSVLETKLLAANQSLEKLRAQKTSGGGVSSLMDLGTKKVGAQGKAKPRKTGMSVVNPASRKRKAATGVVFD